MARCAYLRLRRAGVRVRCCGDARVRVACCRWFCAARCLPVAALDVLSCTADALANVLRVGDRRTAVAVVACLWLSLNRLPRAYVVCRGCAILLHYFAVLLSADVSRSNSFPLAALYAQAARRRWTPPARLRINVSLLLPPLRYSRHAGRVALYVYHARGVADACLCAALRALYARRCAHAGAFYRVARHGLRAAAC